MEVSLQKQQLGHTTVERDALMEQLGVLNSRITAKDTQLTREEINSARLKVMKSTKVQTSPVYLSHALKHIPQSTEPRAVLGSKYVMATPAQFVKLSER